MSFLSLVLIGLFLPLFPFSIGFNFLLGQVKHPLLKSAILVLWPLLGLVLFFQLNIQPPSWIIGWATFTAWLYAYRLLTQRDVHVWIGFLATSIWSLFWIPLLISDLHINILTTYTLGFGIPLALLVLLANELKKRFGVAYTHLYGGLATTMPRFSGLLIVTILASIATPLFPSFFIMLKMLDWVTSPATLAIAVILLLIWLIWSWAGIRVIQGLLTGSVDQRYEVEDLHIGATWVFVFVLTVLAASGLFISGDLL